MSVLTELSIFPLDKTGSLSPYVSRVIELIRGSGVEYKLNPMGTVFETEDLRSAHIIIEEAYALLAVDCERVYLTVKIDIKKSAFNCINTKLASIEQKIGDVSK